MARTHSTSETTPTITLHLNDNGTWRTETIIAALLADVLRELQQLNRTLNCHRVPAGMDALIRAERRLAKHMPLRPRRRGSK